MGYRSSPYEVFAWRADQQPDIDFAAAPASARLPWAPDGYAITYGEALHEVRNLQDRYTAAGYGHGSRVALLLVNRPTFLLHWLALNAIGASIIPLNADLRPEELLHQLQVSGANAVIAVPGFEALLEAGVPAGVPVALVDEAPPQAKVRRVPRIASATDEAALLFTSGSTGKPKACILSNHYFMTLARWYLSLPGVSLAGNEVPVALTPLPFHHMNALGCTAVGMMLAGGTIVPLDRFHPKRWWQTVSESGATIAHGLGVIPAILLQLEEGTFDTRHRAHALFSPGVDAAHKVAFEARFGLPILEGWAMTETGGAAVIDTVGLTENLGPRCIGHSRTNSMEWRIVDDGDQDVAQGVPGELLVRTSGSNPRDGFFSGYLGDETATEEAWRGGWFHTGDVMRIMEDNTFFFVDRKKSIVRRSGENISALEVEAALLDDHAVRAAAVTPVSDDLRGEEVFAFVVPAAEKIAEDFANALVSRLAVRLSYQKLPGFVSVVDTLPLSPTQKLLRGKIRGDAEQAVRDGQAIDLRKTKSALRVKT